MSDITINFSKVNSQVNEMETASRGLKKVGRLVSSEASKNYLQSEGSAAVRKRLKDIYEEIMQEAVKMDSLAEALQHIAQCYEKAEKNIAGSFRSGTIASTSDSSEDCPFWSTIRKWLMWAGLLPAEKQERVEGEAVTKDQQKEQDLYMKKEIKKIKKKDRYSKKTWEKASASEREAILREYIQEVASTMGISISQVTFKTSAPENGYITSGYYSSSGNLVNLNSWLLQNGDAQGWNSYDLFETVVHELRHAYQYQACENPENFVVTEETLNSWQDSFDNYKDTDGFMEEGMGQREAYEAYRNQAVEADARSFAGQD